MNDRDKWNKLPRYCAGGCGTRIDDLPKTSNYCPACRHKRQSQGARERRLSENSQRG